MRGLVYLVLALVAALLLGLGFLLVRPQSWWPQVSASISGLLGSPSPRPAAPPAAPVKTKNEPERKPSTRSPGSGDRSTPPAPAPPAPQPGAAAMRFPFPVAEQITAGTPRSTILATFGRPQATVAGAESGQLRERYVYVDPATGRRTFIFLIDASVSRAETVSQ